MPGKCLFVKVMYRSEAKSDYKVSVAELRAKRE